MREALCSVLFFPLKTSMIFPEGGAGVVVRAGWVRHPLLRPEQQDPVGWEGGPRSQFFQGRFCWQPRRYVKQAWTLPHLPVCLEDAAARGKVPPPRVLLLTTGRSAVRAGCVPRVLENPGRAEVWAGSPGGWGLRAAGCGGRCLLPSFSRSVPSPRNVCPPRAAFSLQNLWLRLISEGRLAL